MTFFRDLKSWVRLDEDLRTVESDVSEMKPLFVYVKMPVDLDPLDRCALYADPLQRVLEQEKVGTVTGGGSLLSATDDEVECQVEFSGIDVDLYEVAKGLALLRQELIRLQAPPGTLLVYELNGHEWQDPIYPDKVC